MNNDIKKSLIYKIYEYKIEIYHFLISILLIDNYFFNRKIFKYLICNLIYRRNQQTSLYLIGWKHVSPLK